MYVSTLCTKFETVFFRWLEVVKQLAADAKERVADGTRLEDAYLITSPSPTCYSGTTRLCVPAPSHWSTDRVCTLAPSSDRPIIVSLRTSAMIDLIYAPTVCPIAVEYCTIYASILFHTAIWEKLQRKTLVRYEHSQLNLLLVINHLAISFGFLVSIGYSFTGCKIATAKIFNDDRN